MAKLRIINSIQRGKKKVRFLLLSQLWSSPHGCCPWGRKSGKLFPSISISNCQAPLRSEHNEAGRKMVPEILNVSSMTVRALGTDWVWQMLKGESFSRKLFRASPAESLHQHPERWATHTIPLVQRFSTFVISWHT